MMKQFLFQDVCSFPGPCPNQDDVKEVTIQGIFRCFLNLL